MKRVERTAATISVAIRTSLLHSPSLLSRVGTYLGWRRFLHRSLVKFPAHRTMLLSRYRPPKLRRLIICRDQGKSSRIIPTLYNNRTTPSGRTPIPSSAIFNSTFPRASRVARISKWGAVLGSTRVQCQVTGLRKVTDVSGLRRRSPNLRRANSRTTKGEPRHGSHRGKRKSLSGLA